MFKLNYSGASDLALSPALVPTGIAHAHAERGRRKSPMRAYASATPNRGGLYRLPRSTVVNKAKYACNTSAFLIPRADVSPFSAR